MEIERMFYPASMLGRSRDSDDRSVKEEDPDRR
jgi:hypothetical protein